MQRSKKQKSLDAIPFSVFKVTGLSRFELLEKANDGVENLTNEEKREFADVIQRVDSICKAAHDLDVPVFIDAEDSWIQDAIDRMADAMMAKYNLKKPLYTTPSKCTGTTVWNF